MENITPDDAKVRAHHPLNTGGERHTTVYSQPGAHDKRWRGCLNRSKYMFHCHENGVKTLNVEEGFLLTGKRSVRHIFCGGGGAHRKKRRFVIGGKL